MNYKDLPRGVNLLLVGPPGVGKTASVSAAFEHCEILLSSCLVEEDIAGLPFRDGDEEKRTIPTLFKNLNAAASEGKSACLLLDELDKARRGVADTLLTLVQSRKMQNFKLHDDIKIIAVANNIEFGGGDGISEAMLSRFAVIDFSVSRKGWARWARESLLDSISDAYKESVKHIINKVESQIISIFEYEGDGLDLRITCPRTLHKAILTLASSLSDDAKSKIFSGLLVKSDAVHFDSELKKGLLIEKASELIRKAAINKADPVLRIV